MCTHNICFEQKYNNYKKNNFNCHFTAMKNSCLLHGHVFVMMNSGSLTIIKFYVAHHENISV